MIIHCGRCGLTFTTAEAFAAHNPHTSRTDPATVALKRLEGQNGVPTRKASPRVVRSTGATRSTP